MGWDIDKQWEGSMNGLRCEVGEGTLVCASSDPDVGTASMDTHLADVKIVIAQYNADPLMAAPIRHSYTKGGTSITFTAGNANDIVFEYAAFGW